MFDVANGVDQINKYLAVRGFTARDADQNDFQRGKDSSLRFKTGTMRGEVTITVWDATKQLDVIRVLSNPQLQEAMYEIDRIIQNEVMF